MFKHSSRSLELNDSTYPFRHGLPGGMYDNPVLVPDQSATASKTNSGPLAHRNTIGAPCSATSSSRISMNHSAVIDRSTRPPKHTLVCSSTMEQILIALPRSAASNWKSTAYTMPARPQQAP